MLVTSCKNKAKVVQMEDYKFGCSDISIYLLIKNLAQLLIMEAQRLKVAWKVALSFVRVKSANHYCTNLTKTGPNNFLNSFST